MASFIECLLLISYEVVGIRGTPTQAQQPSITKAGWERDGLGHGWVGWMGGSWRVKTASGH